jgi:hypothetical protein
MVPRRVAMVGTLTVDLHNEGAGVHDRVVPQGQILLVSREVETTQQLQGEAGLHPQLGSEWAPGP